MSDFITPPRRKGENKMKTKKAIKKIAALAGSALMLGSTMVGALAAIGDLPTPFVDSTGVFDSYIVVGSGAAISDLVGAVEVAAAFAQNAVSGGTGLVTFQKNTTAGVLNESGIDEGVSIKGTAQAVTFTADSDGFSWLWNGTVEYYNETTKDTVEYTGFDKLQMGGTSGGPFVTDFGKALFEVSDLIVYNLTFNDTIPEGAEGIMWLGNAYELVESSTTEVTLGQIETETLTLNEKLTVGDEGAKVYFADMDSVLQEIYFVVEDSDGNIAYEEWLGVGEDYDNTTLGISNIGITSFHYSVITGTATAKISIRTAGVILKDGNLTDDELWEIDMDATANGVNWIGLKSVAGYPSADETTEYVEPNTVLAGPESYWNFYHDGLVFIDDGEDTTSITVKTEFSEDSTYELSYKDDDDDTVVVDLDTKFFDGTDFDEYPQAVPVGNRTITSVTLQGSQYYLWVYNNSISACNVTWVNGTDVYVDIAPGEDKRFGNAYYDFAFSTDFTDKTLNLTVHNYTADSTTPTVPKFGGIYNISYTNATQTVTIEDDGNDVTVDLDSGDIKVGGKSADDDEYRYTTFGTGAIDNGISATIVVPETERVAQISIGRKLPAEFTVAVGETDDRIDDALVLSGGGQTIKAIEPKFAFLDTEKPTPDKPVILVGGPAINTLVSGIGNETWTVNDWREEVNGTRTKMNRAIIDLVESAFSTYDALVIAGYGEDQTRIAARLLAKELMYGGTILADITEDRAVLDTTDATISDYSAATLVTE
jgi:hypothetical protein